MNLPELSWIQFSSLVADVVLHKPADTALHQQNRSENHFV
jgi:hypothetical protein